MKWLWLRLRRSGRFWISSTQKNLQAQDYVEGPVIDELNKKSEMWVFGKDVKGREVYIKITLGYQNGQTICISFHIAEHPLQYPFKSR